MDAVSGLSRDKIAEMDRIVGAGLGNTPPSLAQQIGTALVKPAKDYGKMVAGAGYEVYRAGKSALGDKNAYWDEKTRQNVPNPFLDQKELEQFSDPKSASLEGTKRAVGMMSYFPGGSLPKAVVAGTMYGFSQTPDSASVDEYVKDTIKGGAYAGAGYGIAKLGGAVWDKLVSKATSIMKTPTISDEVADKTVKHILQKASDGSTIEAPGTAEAVYGSGFSFSKKGHAFETLKPQETFKTMIKDEVWGTPKTIIEKANKVTGENGVVSNLVKSGLDDLGTIELPNGLISADDITGRYTSLSNKDVNGLLTRLGKAAPGDTITGKSATSLFKFQQDLESEAYGVLARNSSNGKAVEFAKLQIELSKKIENALDQAIESSGTTVSRANDPAIVSYLADNVSPQFAKRFQEASGSLRGLRSLQKDYYRMAEIARLSSQENSSLGKTLFRWMDNLPVVGPTVSALSKQTEAYLGTGAPILANKIIETTKNIPQSTAALANKSLGVVGSATKRVLPLVGASLGGVPPKL